MNTKIENMIVGDNIDPKVSKKIQNQLTNGKRLKFFAGAIH